MKTSPHKTTLLKADQQKAKFLKGLKEAICDGKLIKDGKLKGLPAKEVLILFSYCK